MSEISTGPQYTVHRARADDASELTSDVAIKRLRPALQHESARARLLREAHIGLALRGSNIVRVLEVHSLPELFVVMQHLEGVPLTKLLAAGCPLEVSLRVLVDALHGLTALHYWKDERGLDFVVHRAPSPRHMHVGSDGVTRLIDLSHAHGSHIGGLRIDSSLRQNELAPEQITAPSSVDPRCDIFIVGLALWQVLTGAPLFAPGRADADTRFALAFPLRKLCDSGAPEKAAAFDAICQRALAPQRQDRFGSAAEMAAALQDVASEAGLFADYATVGAWTRKVLSLLQPASASEPSQTQGRRTYVPPAPTAPVPFASPSEPTRPMELRPALEAVDASAGEAVEQTSSEALIHSSERLIKRSGRPPTGLSPLPASTAAALTATTESPSELSSGWDSSLGLQGLSATSEDSDVDAYGGSPSLTDILQLAASESARRSYERGRDTYPDLKVRKARKTGVLVAVALGVGAVIAGASMRSPLPDQHPTQPSEPLPQVELEPTPQTEALSGPEVTPIIEPSEPSFEELEPTRPAPTVTQLQGPKVESGNLDRDLARIELPSTTVSSNPSIQKALPKPATRELREMPQRPPERAATPRAEPASEPKPFKPEVLFYDDTPTTTRSELPDNPF